MTALIVDIHTIPDRDGNVTCPCGCNHQFKVRRGKRGDGASYVRTWDAVPRQLLDIMSIWMSFDELRDCDVTKNRAVEIIRARRLKTSTGSLYARISEMLGLRILRVVPPGETRRAGSHQTDAAPLYRLDVERASAIMNNGGVLP